MEKLSKNHDRRNQDNTPLTPRTPDEQKGRSDDMVLYDVYKIHRGYIYIQTHVAFLVAFDFGEIQQSFTELGRMRGSYGVLPSGGNLPSA